MKAGITIEQFWEYTPKEINLIVEAKQFEIERQWQMLAWAVAHIISYTGKLKRPVSPEKLLGKKKKHRMKRKIDKQKEWEELKRMFKAVK